MQNLKNYKTPKDWNRGAYFYKLLLWRIIGFPLVASFIPGSKWRKLILITYGAKIGKCVKFKPYIKVSYPWRLKISDYCWIGEEVWIDNIDLVKISKNVCISQRVYLCTGNHNYKKTSFDLLTSPIIIHEGSWIGACSCISPGTIIGRNSVITFGSVVNGLVKDNSIYTGNKANFVKYRKFED